MPVRAGSPTPADDQIEEQLDLTQYLVRHPESTYLVRCEGESMIDAFIRPGDLLVVDKAIQPRHNDTVIASVQGEFTVKTFSRRPYLHLVSRNSDRPTEIKEPFNISGVVLWVIHKAH